MIDLLSSSFVVVWICMIIAQGFPDTSPEGRHARFLSNGQGRIGDNMYSPSWQNYNKEDVIKTTTLPNGNIENEYKWYGEGGCRRFYEYEPNSGVIVGFRFEEDKKYDCQVNTG